MVDWNFKVKPPRTVQTCSLVVVVPPPPPASLFRLLKYIFLVVFEFHYAFSDIIHSPMFILLRWSFLLIWKGNELLMYAQVIQ